MHSASPPEPCSQGSADRGAIITPQVALMAQEGILKPEVGIEAEASAQRGIAHKSPGFLQTKTVPRISGGGEGGRDGYRWVYFKQF